MYKDASDTTASPDQNALFYQSQLWTPTPTALPASYPEIQWQFEESEAWDNNVNETPNSWLHYGYDCNYSYQAGNIDELLSDTNSGNADGSIVSWIVSDSTPQICPPLAIVGELESPWHLLNWGCPSVSSETSLSTSSTPRVSSCDWPQCQSREFGSAQEHKIHSKTHARDVRNRWQPSEPFNRCTWHNCLSKAQLKTTKQLEDHINNIHINPLLCTRDGCQHKTPFRGKADLQRHIDSVHGNIPKLQCPYQTCHTSNEKPYSRKDKLINHLRKIHDTDPCPYHHCMSSMFSSPDYCESTAKHIGKMHGEYECALKSCFNTRSQFSEESFMAHLHLHHDIEWEFALKTRDTAKRAEGRILRDEHLAGLFEFSDCTSCTKL